MLDAPLNAAMGSAFDSEALLACCIRARAGALVSLMALDAQPLRSGCAGCAGPRVAGGFAEAFDYAKQLSDALDGIDSMEGIVAGAFESLSPAEAHLLVFERALRPLWKRKAAG